MKRICVILILCLLFSPAALAESTHADDFFSGLSQAWDGLVGMAQDAGQAVSDWANESGVTAWLEGAARDVSAWAQDIGLTAWADGALKDISAWADDSGLTAWADEISAQAQALYEENRPAVEAWLNQAGEEVTRAWNTLVNADDYTQAELHDAFETVTESLNASGSGQ